MSIADQVRDYIRKNQGVLNAMSMGIVNYSSLARKIMEETGIKNFDAIISTLKRIETSVGVSDQIKSALKSSKIETVTGISYLVLRSSTANIKKAVSTLSLMIKDYHKYRIIQSVQGIGIVLDDSEFERFTSSIPKTEIIESMRNVGELIITSHEDTTFIKGYVAYITNLLSNNGINLLQIISFYTDVTLILELADVARAFDTIIKEISY